MKHEFSLTSISNDSWDLHSNSHCQFSQFSQNCWLACMSCASMLAFRGLLLLRVHACHVLCGYDRRHLCAIIQGLILIRETRAAVDQLGNKFEGASILSALLAGLRNSLPASCQCPVPLQCDCYGTLRCGCIPYEQSGHGALHACHLTPTSLVERRSCAIP